MPLFKFRTYSVHHPENRGPKSGSQTGPNLHFPTIFQTFLPFVPQNYYGFLSRVKALQWAHFGKNRMFRKFLLLELWPKTQILKKVPKIVKIMIFRVFLKFGYQVHSGFIFQVRGLQRAHSGESRMFRSHPILQLRFKTVSTNHIVRFFKLQYLKNSSTV